MMVTIRRMTFRGPPVVYTTWVTAGLFLVTVAVLVAAGLEVVRKQAMSCQHRAVNVRQILTYNMILAMNQQHVLAF